MLKNKMVISYMNSYSQGKSGGDVIFAEVWKRQVVGRHFIITSKAGRISCDQIGLKSPLYVVTTYENAINNIIAVYFRRIFWGIIKSWNLPRPDILYVSSDILPDVIPALLLKIKYLFSFRRPLWVQKIYHINQRERLVSYYSQKVSIWLISKFSDLNITCSYKSRDDFVKAGLSREKVNVVFPGIDLDYINSVPSSRKGFDGVYLGRLALSKGIDEIVPIWKKVVKFLPGIRLGIIGEGSADVVQNLKNQIVRSGLSSNVEILGFLTDDEAFGILKSSRIFVFPSHEEGFGIVIAEALACGCVPVTYDLPVYKGIFDDRIEKVACFDKKAFAEAIIFLIQNELVFTEKVEEGKNFVSRFSWQRASQNEIDLIEGIINQLPH